MYCVYYSDYEFYKLYCYNVVLHCSILCISQDHTSSQGTADTAVLHDIYNNQYHTPVLHCTFRISVHEKFYRQLPATASRFASAFLVGGLEGWAKSVK